MEADGFLDKPRGIPQDFHDKWLKIVRGIVFSKKQPKTLYHYTDYESCVKIIDNDSLLMFSPLTSNDENELVEAQKYIDGAISNIELRGRNSKERQQFIDKIVHTLPELFDDYFILSLTEGQDEIVGALAPEDRLVQWRTYGRDGHGVAIALRTETLKDKAKQEFERTWLASALYDDKEKEAAVKSIVEKAVELRSEYGIKYQDMVPYVCYAFMYIIPLFKHVGFSEEREWRLISRASRKSRYGNKNMLFGGISKSYMSIPLEIDSTPSDQKNPVENRIIEKITIGPSPNKKIYASSLNQLMKSKYAIPNIDLSKIPYRSSK